ncbi:MAG: hypothetical protein ACXAEX_03300 [Promethearchaeota archaeon]|jgi:hypothetical protein
MVVFIKPINKFKTYKFDAAPFFFFIDIFPPEYTNKNKPNLANLINSVSTNPIMPLPMRVDRVFNGERSILIRPKEPITFPITEELTAIINPVPFLHYGFEKLLYFTEVRAREQFFLSMSPQRTLKWWNITRFLYGNLPTLEADFSAFLRAYLHTIIKAKLLDEDPVEAALSYSQLMADICKKRLDQNMIQIEIKGKEENVKMYKVKELKYYKKFKKTKETQYHPELIDIEIYNLTQKGFNEGDRTKSLNGLNTLEIKYIPILIYDDLLECMLQNIKRIEEKTDEMMSPSFLFDNQIVITEKSEDLESNNIKNYSWWNSFDTIELNPMFETIRKLHEEYIATIDTKQR